MNKLNFTMSLTREINLPMLIHLPPDSVPQPWPLILYLHDVQHRGDDVEAILGGGVPFYARLKEDLPFVVLAPLCPEDRVWMSEIYTLAALITAAPERYQIDPDRVYITGAGMGAEAAWAMALRFPTIPAAIAPISGQVDVTQVHHLKDLPIWMVHGEEDEVIPVEVANTLYNTLMAYNASGLTYISYNSSGHNVADQAYEDPDLYTWFLSHTRKQDTINGDA